MGVKENYEYFEDNFEELYKKYPEKYLVIKDKNVERSFDSFDQAADFGIRTYGVGSFSVQHCTPKSRRTIFISRRVTFAEI